MILPRRTRHRLHCFFRAPVILTFEMVCILYAISTVTGVWAGIALATLANGR